MKIRNGFVSNSSVSSFIVHHYNYWTKQKKLLDIKTIKKLLAYGFKETYITHPTHLDNVNYEDDSIWKAEDNTKSYGYWVSCNQDEVIKWLVKNNIGFIATTHYGHTHCVFHKNDKYLMVFNNYGVEVETYEQQSKWEDIVKRWKPYRDQPYYRIPIKQIIKEW